jgi:hypothetical protein
MAAINVVLMILRTHLKIFICAPCDPPDNLSPVAATLTAFTGGAYDIYATVEQIK